MIETRAILHYGKDITAPIIHCVQGDSGREVLFTLADYVIPAECTATYFVKKPSGLAVYNAAEIVDSQSIRVALTAQSIAEVGEAQMQIRIMRDEVVITSFDVLLDVRQFLGVDAMESTTEANIFDEYINEALEEIDQGLSGKITEAVDGYLDTHPAIFDTYNTLSDKPQIDGVTLQGNVNLAGDMNPQMDGEVSPGTALKYARQDHVHPHDTTKVDKVSGKGLSTNDYTTAEKNKLAAIVIADINKYLKNYFDSRPASADVMSGTRDGAVKQFLATSAMTTGKPPIGDSHVLHFGWDTSGWWDTQVAFLNDGRHLTAKNAFAMRAGDGVNNVWCDWKTLLDLLYPVGSVYITNSNVNPSNNALLGGGTWTLIKRVFAIMRADNPVNFNTTNTVSGSTSSTFWIRGQSVKFRMRFTNKVALSDTAVTIGSLDLSYVGLTGAYYATYIATDDTGNAGAMIDINSTEGYATIKVIDVVGGTSIAASTSTTPTITLCGELYFDTSSMRDADCDEFHWKRTA